MSVQCPICNNEIKDGVAECSVCGYHLLGSTESFTPISIESDELQQDAKAQQFDLRVVRGPQTGVDIALHEGTLSIGRDPRCDIFLNDMTVSRRHAEIEVGAKRCVLRDKNSFNGVWVNDRAIETCLLKSGDLIQIGAFCLLYRERL